MKTCKACEGVVPDDLPNNEPCPHCNTVGPRNITIQLQPLKIKVYATSPHVVIVRHWTNLLNAAERLFQNGEYAPSVVVAATACEVIVERAMTKAFTTKNVPELEKPTLNFVFTFALYQKKNRVLYTCLTGDQIDKQGFWQAYLLLVERRNKTVHSGNDVPQTDARAAIDAAKQFVSHVEKHNGLQ